jgi:hypothetical protein
MGTQLNFEIGMCSKLRQFIFTIRIHQQASSPFTAGAFSVSASPPNEELLFGDSSFKLANISRNAWLFQQIDKQINVYSRVPVH